MPENEFQNWTLRFDCAELPIDTSPKGLDVVRSVWVSEWVAQKGFAINGARFTGPCDYMIPTEQPQAGLFAADSDGKYKSMKICFRLVYSLKSH